MNNPKKLKEQLEYRIQLAKDFIRDKEVVISTLQKQIDKIDNDQDDIEEK